MSNEQIKIEDGSNDKRYFTILPNYIANHSSAIDQALYLQMKRIAGEDGKCFATEKTLCEKLKVGRRALWSALKYLQKNGWITYIGLTKSKTRPIKTYKVNDLWQLNNEFYDKSREISAEKHISLGGDKSPKAHKISAEKHIEEEPFKEYNPPTPLTGGKGAFNNTLTETETQKRKKIAAKKEKVRDILKESVKKLAELKGF